MFDENGKKIIKRKTPMKLVHHQNWYTALLQDLVLWENFLECCFFFNIAQIAGYHPSIKTLKQPLSHKVVHRRDIMIIMTYMFTQANNV